MKLTPDAPDTPDAASEAALIFESVSDSSANCFAETIPLARTDDGLDIFPALCSSITGSCEIISCFSCTSIAFSTVSFMYNFNSSSTGIVSRIVCKIHSLIIISNSLEFFCDFNAVIPISNKYTFVYTFRATLI